jgi:uncharacterized RmlC-like cupin family protein
VEAPALARCVGNVERFFQRDWARAPFLHETRGEAGFDDLASLDDLDHMISSQGLRASSLRMVQGGKTLPVSAYTTPAGSKSRTTDRPVDAASVYRRFEEGATIVLESLHRYWRPLTDFCRELELALGHRLQVNAYITPPGSQGFDVHSDGHDVFVLQVSGAKHWIVYDREDEEQVLIDRDVERGEALYIPTGFPHAASAGAGASAHLTVGILTHDSIDVVREVVKLAEEEAIFADRLPVGSTTDASGLREIVLSTVDELRAWLDKVDPDELTQRFARKVMSSAQPLVRDQLRQLALIEGIDASTELVRRSGAVCVLFPGDTYLKVLLVDRELQMPLAALDAMQEVAGRERLRPGDLHPSLEPDSALVLIRRLVREGLLEVVVEG